MYDYKKERAYIFTEDGSVDFLRVRDRVNYLLGQAGAIRMDCAMSASKASSSWKMLACVDRMVELGELREITANDVAGQNRVFVSGRGAA